MRRKCGGFTFIELLVSLAITGVVLSLGLAKYNEFNRRQIVVQAAQGLKANLRLAQSRALAAEKQCSGEFLGYKVLVFSDSYYLFSECRDGEGPRTSYQFPERVNAYAGETFEGFLFKPLGEGLEESGEVYLAGYGTYERVAVEKVAVETAGNIYVEEVEDLPPTVQLLPPASAVETPTPTPTPTPIACAGHYESCLDRPCCDPNWDCHPSIDQCMPMY